MELTSQLLTVRSSLHQAEARCAELEAALQAAERQKRAAQEAKEAQEKQLHALQLEHDHAVALADQAQHVKLQADAAAAMAPITYVQKHP